MNGAGLAEKRGEEGWGDFVFIIIIITNYLARKPLTCCVAVLNPHQLQPATRLIEVHKSCWF